MCPDTKSDWFEISNFFIRSFSEMIVVVLEDAMKWLDVSIPMIFQLVYSRYENIITMWTEIFNLEYWWDMEFAFGCLYQPWMHFQQ